MKLLRVMLGLVLSISLGGCYWYTYPSGDVLPVSPASSRWVQDVESLQPSFTWDTTDVNRPVDLAIWEAIFIPLDERRLAMRLGVAKKVASQYSQGKLIYQKKAIQGRTHRIETPLHPDKVYFWSIKHSDGHFSSFNIHFCNVKRGECGDSEFYFAIKTPASK